MKRGSLFLVTIMLSFFVAFTIYPGNMVKAADPIIIVIDPGHGGANLGTNFLPTPEKDYTMMVALYMKKSLEQYDNVEVYLTHNDDIDMSLKERAEFAESVNADFLYSLHFNMSENHTLYGSEVWIPSTGILFSQGYSQGYEFIKEFTEMGLFNRGIKTRVSQNSGEDYYGIIRQCALRDIPAIIVEHCHVDHANDIANIISNDKLKEFGERDARAVARYFGLTTKDKKTDYRDYAPIAVPVPSERVWQDLTPPEYVKASLIKYDKISKYASFTLSATDPETNLLYYSYSTDDGQNWSVYQPWKSSSGNMTVTVKMNYGKKDSVMFKVLNQYDKETISEPICLY